MMQANESTEQEQKKAARAQKNVERARLYYQEHSNEIRERRKRQYEERKSKHQCPVCGIDLARDWEFTHCNDCLDNLLRRQDAVDKTKVNAKRRVKYAERKRNGLCPRCGVSNFNGKILCNSCLEKAKQANEGE